MESIQYTLLDLGLKPEIALFRPTALTHWIVVTTLASITSEREVEQVEIRKILI